MKPLQVIGVVSLWLSISFESLAQSIPVEVFTGHEAYRYQQSFTGKINKEFGISHSSSLLEIFNENETEIMTQTYFTIAIHNGVKLGVGTFYASVPGFTPSVNLQFAKKKSDWLLLIVPRIDLREKPAYDLMMMFEYNPQINAKVRLYARLQTMENYTGSKHNRGYLHSRLGVHLKKVQIGVAVGLESYGKKYVSKDNYGLFFRTEI